MIKIDNVWTGGFEGALRGMRNPYMSHDKSDSGEGCIDINSKCWNCKCLIHEDDCGSYGFYIGSNDMALCKKLIAGGSEHRKFLRMIHVQAEVKAPRYFWQEADKYKWIEANSSSTMHLITKRELTLNDFSYTPLSCDTVKYVMDEINCKIQLYNQVSDKESKDKVLIAIKQMLPESYNQLRMIDTNYECLLNIYHQRKNHRLTEWHDFCKWIESLPYMEDFLCLQTK